MSELVLHPTATAQWHALVEDAAQTCATPLEEDLESYLVFLLMQYHHDGELLNSTLALEYLHSFEFNGRLRQEHLREVGDKCLLFSGLFPGQAERRRVRVSYYANLGISAYTLLAESVAGMKAKIYEKLSDHFVAVMDVLQAVRDFNKRMPTLQPLQAIELWNDTGSVYALHALSHYTSALPLKTAIPEFKPHYRTHHTTQLHIH